MVWLECRVGGGQTDQCCRAYSILWPFVQDLLQDPHEAINTEGGSRFSKWFAAQAMAAGNQAGHDMEGLSNSNVNNNLVFNHRNSPTNVSDDFNYLSGESLLLV